MLFYNQCVKNAWYDQNTNEPIWTKGKEQSPGFGQDQVKFYSISFPVLGRSPSDFSFLYCDLLVDRRVNGDSRSL